MLHDGARLDLSRRFRAGVRVVLGCAEPRADFRRHAHHSMRPRQTAGARELPGSHQFLRTRDSSARRTGNARRGCVKSRRTVSALRTSGVALQGIDYKAHHHRRSSDRWRSDRERFMLFSSLHDLRGGLPKRLTLPAIAFGLVLLYFVSLHPATGFLGGAFFLLLGWWFIPFAINLLLAAWLASLFKVHKTLRAAIFVAASFFLGMNTLLPTLLRSRSEASSSANILRVIRIKSGETVDAGLMTARLADEASYPSAPSALGVRVGENEGCMCMWWAPSRGPSSEWQVWGVINAYLHRPNGIEGPLYIGMGNMALGKAHFDVRFMRGATPKTVNLLLTIYDGWDVTAVYRQSAIPVESTSPPKAHGAGLGDHFYRNTLSMLVRQNFWVFLLDNQMSGFSAEPLKSFLRRAVIVE